MNTQILIPNPDTIQLVAQAIRQGEVVGMPTETVYGLAGDATSSTALARIFATKERPSFDPLIIHIGLFAEGENPIEGLKKTNLVHFSAVPKQCEEELSKLMSIYWPGPLTLVLPKTEQVPDLATSGLSTVAIRMPSHPVAQALIRASERPLAAPSANRFGRISPTTAEAVQAELDGRISWILDGGPCKIGVESTVLYLMTNPDSYEWLILRPGGISQNSLEETLGKSVPFASERLNSSNDSSAVPSPGLLENHYAPRTPLKLLDRELSQFNENDFKILQNQLEKLNPRPQKIGILQLFGNPGPTHFYQKTGIPAVSRVLSPTGDLTEAARQLFAEMRWLDSSNLDLILAEPCPLNYGLGHAISDRLKKASQK